MSVEEAHFLIAVDGVVGGVEIEDEFLGGDGETLDEGFDEGGGDVEERSSPDAIFESAKCGRRGEFGHIVGPGMVRGGLPKRIVAKPLMIVEVFVAAGDAEDSLGEQASLGMQNEVGIAWIGNGSIERIDESDLPIGLPHEQRSGVGGDRPAGEIGNEISLSQSSEGHGSLVTLCHRDGSWPREIEVW